MERTWLCEKTLNLYKDGGECFLGKRLSGGVGGGKSAQSRRKMKQSFLSENDS
ncbi:hypothetical protein T11_10778 [Trichinella zimbabwensis]|uniref:Uncharacterized protein n=1 Tax=Trichinella zimbabwensis TaxID=268475 RepID=A0A0V1G6P2_9BILA|nr:hypothetical protein T11_10778 [Trichinella zimbabwensis]